MVWISPPRYCTHPGIPNPFVEDLTEKVDWVWECDECKKARSINHKSQTQKTQAKRIMKDGRLFHPTAKHGTRSAYTYHGCRCDKCREGMRLIQQRSKNER